MFAFSGAHRSGKTTLAKDVAARLALPYLDASTSATVKELGLDSGGKHDMQTRVMIQRHILNRYMEKIYAQQGPFITDRTPLDMIGYMAAEVPMYGIEPEVAAEIDLYYKECLHHTARNFRAIIFARPLPNYVTEPGKPPMNAAYQWHVQYIMEGALQQIRKHICHAALVSDDHEARVASSVNFLTEEISKIVYVREAVAHLH